MNTHEMILTEADRVFDENGFAATGMDRIAGAASVSSRTLYKHIGSKTALIRDVLGARHRRFLDHMQARDVAGLFDLLETWIAKEGARGCLFLRAGAETGGSEPQVTAAIDAYRKDLRALISGCLDPALGHPPPECLVTQVQVLFEGATTAASYLGADAVYEARAAATALLDTHA